MYAPVLRLDRPIPRRNRPDEVITGRACLLLFGSARLCATHDGEAVADGWIAEDPGTRITVADGANEIALWTWQSV